MLGGMVLALGMLISGELVTRAMRELKRHHPETVKKHRFLLTFALLAVYGYCLFLCVLIGAIVNGSPLDSPTVLFAQKLIVFLFLAGFAVAITSAAIAHLSAAKKATGGNPRAFKRGLLLFLLGASSLILSISLFL